MNIPEQLDALIRADKTYEAIGVLIGHNPGMLSSEAKEAIRLRKWDLWMEGTHAAVYRVLGILSVYDGSEALLPCSKPGASGTVGKE